MNNEKAWEEKYQEGYGNNYVESHILRLYFYLLRREFGLKSSKMFDWGMGNGLNAEFLARQGLEVSGCDVSASAVEQARLRVPTRAAHFQATTLGDDSFGINGGGMTFCWPMNRFTTSTTRKSIGCASAPRRRLPPEVCSWSPRLSRSTTILTGLNHKPTACGWQKSRAVRMRSS
ncbi:methyltransferase domain-containing protein [Dechloromonas sp. ZY10]|uniref:class I SAM-dependent methyltransferase n=1 Tax=Dechloromonas aquae TaxID=2664436 RepID=UPI0035290650